MARTKMQQMPYAIAIKTNANRSTLYVDWTSAEPCNNAYMTTVVLQGLFLEYNSQRHVQLQPIVFRYRLSNTEIIPFPDDSSV
jgi:hypothetical protein